MNKKQLEYHRIWRSKNREKINAQHRAWEERNRDRLRIVRKKWRDKNKEYFLKRIKNYHKTYVRKTRILVLRHYGNKCLCCGENNIEFLTIDHIHGNGNKHRRDNLGKFNKSGFPFYRWLIKNNYPDGFQVLCFNCNSSRGFWGYCPHKKNFS